MKCSVAGCDRDAQYKEKRLCQKHYFRLRRNGDFELQLDKKRRELGFSRVYRVTMPGKGYQRVYEPSHPLADKSGYVSEHRKVVYDRYGMELPDCEICGKPTHWDTCHIDHKDNDVTNNQEDNLRPLCRACNTFRDYPEQYTISGHYQITFDGKTMTPTEWSRDPRVSVSHRTIVLRKKRGMSDFDALFSPKITHNGNKLTAKQRNDMRPRKTSAKHERSNSVVITIDGVTATAMEWSRHPECKLSDGAIRNRIRAGMSGKDAVFGEDGRAIAGRKRKEIEQC